MGAREDLVAGTSWRSTAPPHLSAAASGAPLVFGIARKVRGRPALGGTPAAVRATEDRTERTTPNGRAAPAPSCFRIPRPAAALARLPPAARWVWCSTTSNWDQLPADQPEGSAHRRRAAKLTVVEPGDCGRLRAAMALRSGAGGERRCLSGLEAGSPDICRRRARAGTVEAAGVRRTRRLLRHAALRASSCSYNPGHYGGWRQCILAGLRRCGGSPGDRRRRMLIAGGD